MDPLNQLFSKLALLAIESVSLGPLLYSGVFTLALRAALFHRGILAALVTLDVVAKLAVHRDVVARFTTMFAT